MAHTLICPLVRPALDGALETGKVLGPAGSADFKAYVGATPENGKARDPARGAVKLWPTFVACLPWPPVSGFDHRLNLLFERWQVIPGDILPIIAWRMSSGYTS
jgi:hypothetical protein